MSQFDKVYSELVKTVLEKGTMSSGKVRTVYADGTPAHYISYIGYQFRLDNSTDEAHLITSRYAPYKSAIREIYWIAKLRSNNIDELEQLGCKFWREWSRTKVNDKRIVKIQPRIKIKTPLKNIVVNDIVNPNAPIRFNRDGCAFYVLKHFKNEHNQRLVEIQFVNTGYKTVIGQGNLHPGAVKDPYHRSVFGIGYLGDYKSDDIMEYFGIDQINRFRYIWKNICYRCVGKYDYNGINYYDGVFLSDEFQCFANFLRWIMKNNPYGRDGLSHIQIDKDYYKSNCYGPDTCVILTSQLNTLLTLDEWYFMNGTYFFSKQDLIKYLSNTLNIQEGAIVSNDRIVNLRKANLLIDGLVNSGIVKTIYPNVPNYDGSYNRFSLDFIHDIGKAYGYQLAKPMLGRPSQIDYVIDELKNNPNSRRVITELWNVDDSPEMSLLPCAHLTQWSVVNGKLYLEVRQRSCDIALGLVSNVFQYSVLHKLIAKECGLEPAELIWTISNAHIYDRHIEDLKKQIELPTLSGFKLDTSKVESFNEWNNPDDITVPHYAEVVTNKIKYEVAI